MIFGNYRDVPPQETIIRIRKILNELGIFVYEKSWQKMGNNNFSVRIEDAAIPGVGTNGKGISRAYALASAYAEFLERLQNNILYFRDFGLMPYKLNFPDEIEVSNPGHINKLVIMATIGEKEFEKLLNKEKKVKCLPYYSVFKKKVEYLPHDLILSAIGGANGMCAGNCYEEAIVHGICEIFERHMLKKIYFTDSFNAPSIPLEALTEFSVYKLIEEFLENNYHIIVKDLTNGGVLPVLGVIAINPDRTKYKFSTASEVLFETALQRCLTEIGQGFSHYDFEDSMLYLDFSKDQFKKNEFSSDEKQKMFEFNKNKVTHDGQIPVSIFEDSGSKTSNSFNKAFLKEFKNSKEALKFLLVLLNAKNYELFIRDVSCLGFPSFHVYIPKLSELWNWNNHENLNLFIASEKRKKLSSLFKIKKMTAAELSDLANYLESQMDNPDMMNFRDKNISFILRSFRIDKRSDFSNLDTIILMVLIFHKLKNYRKASYYLDLYLKKNKNINHMGYFTCASYYFKMKAIGYTEEITTKNLYELFDEKNIEEVLSDLSDSEKSFDYYTLPNCGFCKDCPIENDCYFPNWKVVISNLNKKLKNNILGQEKLREILENL
jgi:ribosomal protein S12 methylthiotransferase accessory factor